MFLTDREFWLKYWESHRQEVNVAVAENNLFSPVFKQIFAEKDIKSTCELGGFPGTFSIYLKKKYGVNTTLVDYVIHPEILAEVLQTNGLKRDDLTVIEADLFDYTPQSTSDLVFSVGLIEHFDDTAKIISLHLPFLAAEGTLLIFLPNFRGLNGWFQRTFDKENYLKHNIGCMDPALLAEICRNLGLTQVKANWYAHFGLWLERENEKPFAARLLKKSLWFCGKVFFKIFPFNSRWFSPYIVLTARKS